MNGWSSGSADVDDLLRRMCAEVQVVLGGDLLGLYLSGSLALGDFNPRTSDIDFLAATALPLSPAQFEALRAMHARLAQTPGWGLEMEGSYIPRAALRRYTPGDTLHPHLERGSSALKIEQHDTDWIIQRWVVREAGVALFGPDPKTLIDPISPRDLRQAVLDLLWWWQQQLVDTRRVAQSPYQVYAILSMCRIRYTLATGEVLSKPRAARWAMQNLPRSWQPLIARAISWQPGQEMDRLDETLALIRATLDSAKRV